jgi:hypothetical protein
MSEQPSDAMSMPEIAQVYAVFALAFAVEPETWPIFMAYCAKTPDGPDGKGRKLITGERRESVAALSRFLFEQLASDLAASLLR